MGVKSWLLKVRKVFPPEQAEVLEEMVDILDELVKVSDFNELKAIVADLAKAQKELAEAQKRTEERLEELVEAQKRTEEELRLLVEEHRETRRQLGGLSHTVGYFLEDRAYKGLPELLKRDYGIEIIEPLKRDKFKLNGKRIEVNIIGKGIKEGKEIWIIGEAKTQLKKKDVEAFLKRREVFEKLFPGEKIYLLVTYMDVGDAAEYAQKKNIKVYYSYQFPL
ncbi:MAG: chordopoxvirus fusion protein [Caldimicrobium sp.]